tara:strand:- start:793 stop:1611 length:819 start_codon:yes stop_codon:yes gene_type:complete
MVYKDCDIGSAKPNKAILEEHPHHMINVVNLSSVFTVADFCSESHELIKEIHSKDKLPIFVGGSMMYFKSLYEGMHQLPERDKNYRNELEILKINNEPNYLYKLLKDIDPAYAKKINKNDDVRIIRALEVFKKTGEPLSKILLKEPKDNLLKKCHVFQFGILEERDKLHKRIENRLKEIFRMGLVEEAKSLLKKYDIAEDHPIRRSVNYKQAFSYIAGEYELEIAFEKALFATRQLSKRQITWLRSWEDFKMIKLNDTKEIETDFKKIISLL